MNYLPVFKKIRYIRIYIVYIDMINFLKISFNIFDDFLCKLRITLLT